MKIFDSSKVLGKSSDTYYVDEIHGRRNRNAYRGLYTGTEALRHKQSQKGGGGKDIQWAKKAVAESSDVREDVVAPIKARIQSGTYEVSADSFADKLIQKFEELR